MNPAISSTSLYNCNLAQIVEHHCHSDSKLEKFQFIKSLTSHSPKNAQKYPAVSDANMAVASVVGHLQMNGTLYAIVEANNTPKELKPDLANILTRRELQIANLVTLGYSNKQIAHRLKTSEWNICTHLRRVFIKLGVNSRTAMISRCASLMEEAMASSF